MNERYQRGKTTMRILLPLAVIAACFLPVAVTMGAPDQDKPGGAEVPSEADTECARCHACAKPTYSNPCFLPCARISPAAIAEVFAGKLGPGVVILDELEDRFLPVPFDHKGHAEMAEMTTGCAVCHHYTPEGAQHPACKTCHEISPARPDIRKPGLKGAYHRQCMSCHREWGGNTKCALCHPPKIEGSEAAAVPTPDDLVGQMHRPIPEPDIEVYQTQSKPGTTTKVTFRHKEHTARFGLKCAHCHREDSCARCHEEGRKHMQLAKTVEQRHQPCSDCHNVDKDDECGRCHWEEGRPEPGPFVHASTGWPLSRYHKDRSCRVCHVTVPFAKLDRDCNTCHSVWGPETFDHAVTGQRLDENHAESDCEECHIDRKFDRAPTCDECHDEDEGIAFPAKRPGPVVKP